MTISFATSDVQIQRCFGVLAELRSRLNASTFLEDTRRLERQGYRLVYLEDNGAVQSVAGFRFDECFAWGKFIYVYDLVTRNGAGRRGYGSALTDWLIAHAICNGCEEFHLDSGVQRAGAHRFYFKKGLSIFAYHFYLDLRKDGIQTQTGGPLQHEFHRQP
jgi:GNAT superfamily N-acetyltransferase